MQVCMRPSNVGILCLGFICRANIGSDVQSDKNSWTKVGKCRQIYFFLSALAKYHIQDTFYLIICLCGWIKEERTLRKNVERKINVHSETMYLEKSRERQDQMKGIKHKLVNKSKERQWTMKERQRRTFKMEILQKDRLTYRYSEIMQAERKIIIQVGRQLGRQVVRQVVRQVGRMAVVHIVKPSCQLHLQMLYDRKL